MENLWERFDTIAKPEDVMEQKSNFDPLEAGTYKMLLEEISPSESKNGLPMLKGKLRIIENNKVAFYNQMLQNLNSEWATNKNIAEALVFISGIVGEDLDFEELGGLKAFAELIMQIPTGSEHTVEVSYDMERDPERKFTKLTIIRPEDGEETTTPYEGGFTPVGDQLRNDDDLPF